MTDLQLSICHLYPDLLNLYGDRGNLIALERRCAWRDIDCTITSLSLGQPFDPAGYDLVFLGGGQDYEQNLLHQDLLVEKGSAIRQAVEDGVVFLCICGGFQLMGQYYEEQDGRRIECLGALDLWTIARPGRMIGDIICHSTWLEEQARDPVLIGFENHAGRTWLGNGVTPLARVKKGYGNNGEDGTEGAIYKNVYCTYAHGSFLPKNPAMADILIEKALERRYKRSIALENLPDQFENNARDALITCN